MRYRTKVQEVMALKLDQTVKVGGEVGGHGDYLVDTRPGTSGHLCLVKKKEFEARFEPVEETPAKPVRRGGPKKPATTRGPYKKRGGGR